MELGRNARILIFTSPEIQSEIERKLKTKFGVDEKEVAQILFDCSMFTLPIKPLQKTLAIKADPDDDKFIECAVASKAGYIVSGDKHPPEFEKPSRHPDHESSKVSGNLRRNEVTYLFTSVPLLT